MVTTEKAPKSFNKPVKLPTTLSELVWKFNKVRSVAAKSPLKLITASLLPKAPSMVVTVVAIMSLIVKASSPEPITILKLSSDESYTMRPPLPIKLQVKTPGVSA